MVQLFLTIERSVIRLFGFIMESHALIGPSLPPVFKKDTDEDSEDETACKSERNICCCRRNIIVIILYITLLFF